MPKLRNGQISYDSKITFTGSSQKVENLAAGTVATDGINYGQLSGAGGAGMAFSSSQYNIAAADATITVNADNIQVGTINYSNIQNVAANNVILGNDNGAGSVVQELDAAAILTLINVTAGANINVTTNLSEGTATNTTVDVNSSDGTNATLAAASTSRAGVMSKAKFDEVVANTAKTSNANHTGEVTGSGSLTLHPTSISNRTDTAITAADYIIYGDTDDSDNLKKDTVQGIIDLASAAAPGISDISSSTDNAIVRWDGTAGDTIQNSSILIDDSNDITGVGNIAIASRIEHTGFAANHYIEFGSYTTDIWVGGNQAFNIGSTKTIFNPNGDIDLQIKGAGGATYAAFDSDLTFISIGTGSSSITGWLNLTKPVATRAQLNFKPPSTTVNPTTPADGDVWYNGTNLYFYDGSSSIDLLTSGGGAGSALATNMIFIGTSGGVAAEQTMDGDATIDASGTITIANDAITTIKILDANVTTAKIAASNVNNSKLSVMDANRIKGAISSGNPIDLTKAQAKTILGFVEGPASSTDNAIARYDSTTGGLIQDSGITIDDSNNISLNGDIIRKDTPTTKIEIDPSIIQTSVQGKVYTKMEHIASPPSKRFYINPVQTDDVDFFVGAMDADGDATGSDEWGFLGVFASESAAKIGYGSWHDHGWLNLAGSTTKRSALTLFTGANRSNSANAILPGEMWFNGTNLYFSKDGGTQKQDLLAGGGGGAGSALASGNIFIGTSGGVAAEQTVDGEISISTTGTVEIVNDKIDEANLKVNTPTNGYALIARSGESGGLKWEALPGQSTGSGTKVLVTGSFAGSSNVRQTFASGTQTLIEFDDSVTGGTDVNGEWNNNTHRFTVASSGAGVYIFQASLFVESNPGWGSVHLRKGGVQLGTQNLGVSSHNDSHDNIDGSVAVELAVGEYVEFWADWRSGTGTIKDSWGMEIQTFSITKVGESVTVNNVVLPELTKSLYLETPAANDDIGMWQPGVAITITKVVAQTTGSSGTVNYNIYHSGATDLWTSDSQATTTKSVVTSFNNPGVSANEYIQFQISAIANAPTSVKLTITYTED